MARPLRVEFEDAIYHLCARANARQAIFHDEQDHSRFVQLLREIGELFGGLDYASGSPADSPNQVHLQPNCCTAADHRNVKCLDLTPIFPRQVLTVTCYLESIRTGDQ